MVDARSAAFRRFESALAGHIGSQTPSAFRRAVKLLYIHLTPEQRDSICEFGFIRFKTTKADYEIGYGHDAYRRSYFVTTKTRWQRRSFCINPIATVPYPDLFLIHLWSLQADESGWRKTAIPV